MRGNVELESKDWEILNRLQRDALISNKEVAAAVNPRSGSRPIENGART